MVPPAAGFERDDVHGWRADEARGENRRWPRIETVGRCGLLDLSFAHEDDLVGHAHGLALVMGDVDHSDAELLLQRADLAPHLGAQLRVEVGERLVHQANRRLRDDGAAERHALLLAAGKLRRFALEQCAKTEQRPQPDRAGATRSAAGTLRTRKPKRMFSATVR